MPMLVMLSSRERTIAITTVLAVVGVIAYWFVVQPLMNWNDKLADDAQKVELEQRKAKTLVKTNREMTARWRQIKAAGLKDDSSEAESLLRNTVGAWAQETRLALSSVQPDTGPARTGRGKNDKLDLQEFALKVTGSGTMQTVVAFLHRLETAELPIRVRELQLTPKRENTDDLSLVVKVSTLYRAAEPRPAADPTLSTAQRKEEP